ncbi:hypothetical protein IV38_GL000390 [Lactobacillus selangorensis]|uniref:MIP18 family-like domain-containing protein n=1 Tax=Lactobacillus selangorensis TaxID=81857 RepID=A0A0R2FLJ9_9LACO|nr:metal-sulfur cluster assembly factor [Lactobacillus selangorensis]KRN29505.1 hypothetical protein IV38_GL000390 [Lactobacillus selangorensis]KRN33965.1 hypothetical protein IV40_GL000278 [Lactobacillus selangorensis]
MAERTALQEQIIKVLSDVIDPELGVDVVNLGLIYGVDLDEQGHCTLHMTLTTVGCPLTDVLYDELKSALLGVDVIQSVKIELEWDPVWNINMMSPEARMMLGIG